MVTVKSADGIFENADNGQRKVIEQLRRCAKADA
jgi:hypothetical protein